jgi:hypothetical protein
MGLKDRLRDAAAQAQGGLAIGQAKLEQFQSRSIADDHLRALGQAYWIQQSGRATPEQLQALLETVAAPIREAELRSGPLPWPTPPPPPITGATSTMPFPFGTDPSAGPPSAPVPTYPSPGVPSAPPAGVPSAPPAGIPTSPPVAAPSPVPGVASSIPTAIHHDPAEPTDT